MSFYGVQQVCPVSSDPRHQKIVPIKKSFNPNVHDVENYQDVELNNETQPKRESNKGIATSSGSHHFILVKSLIWSQDPHVLI